MGALYAKTHSQVTSPGESMNPNARGDQVMSMVDTTLRDILGGNKYLDQCDSERGISFSAARNVFMQQELTSEAVFRGEPSRYLDIVTSM